MNYWPDEDAEEEVIDHPHSALLAIRSINGVELSSFALSSHTGTNIFDSDAKHSVFCGLPIKISSEIIARNDIAASKPCPKNSPATIIGSKISDTSFQFWEIFLRDQRRPGPN